MTKTQVDTYEFEPGAVVEPGFNKSARLQQVLKDASLWEQDGVGGVYILPIPLSTEGGATPQHDCSTQTDIVEAILESFDGYVVKSDISTVSVKCITDSTNFSRYMQQLAARNHPAANYHTHYHTQESDTKRLLVRPDVGRLVFTLAGNIPGYKIARGTIRSQESDITRYESVEHYIHSTKSVVAGMLGIRGLIIGYDNYFLRAASNDRLPGIKTEDGPIGRWQYFTPGVVRKINGLQQTGQSEIIVDFVPGRDPFRKSN